MPTLDRRLRHVVVWALLLATPTLLPAQAPDPDPARFSASIERFAQWDSQNAFPESGVLFVGSSSIVRWPTAERFPGLPVINRGFGGSHISDVNHFVEETVLKYAPELVVFYAGNNDIAAGKSARQVFGDYQRFVETVTARHPDLQILFISTHPSPARWVRWETMREANELVRAYSERNPRLHFVDIATAMLGGDGRPIAALYVEDGLHLTPAGYDVWTPIVRAAVDAARGAVPISRR